MLQGINRAYAFSCIRHIKKAAPFLRKAQVFLLLKRVVAPPSGCQAPAGLQQFTKVMAIMQSILRTHICAHTHEARYIYSQKNLTCVLPFPWQTKYFPHKSSKLQTSHCQCDLPFTWQCPALYLADYNTCARIKNAQYRSTSPPPPLKEGPPRGPCWPGQSSNPLSVLLEAGSPPLVTVVAPAADTGAGTIQACFFRPLLPLVP
mmetsp:Transcript_22338/g.61752  ORF Transcript_22338/g.61752 Transcript_22338/m.61752 type:complete len:204 (+) Transcript_22338:387-998(+)